MVVFFQDVVIPNYEKLVKGLFQGRSKKRPDLRLGFRQSFQKLPQAASLGEGYLLPGFPLSKRG
jgi:hypothetical protein